MSTSPKVFISYSHRDTRYLERFLIQLEYYRRNNLINLWSDKNIAVGEEWRGKIKEALQSAQIAVLLVSADFLASKFIAENELPPLLTAAHKSGVKIISVILSPCAFNDTPLSVFQAVNSPAKPLSSLKPSQRDALWLQVIDIIKNSVSHPGTDSDIHGNILHNEAHSKEQAYAWLNKGLALANLERHKEALAAFDEALTLADTIVAIWYNKGQAHLQLQQFKQAVTAFNRALSLYPNDPDASYYKEHIVFDAWYSKGLALAGLNRNDEAVAAFDEALALDPTNIGIFVNKGLALSLLNRYDETLAVFDQALHLNPTDSDILINKGLALSNLHHDDEALSAYNQALLLAPTNVGALNNKGLVLSYLGRYKEAISSYDQGLDIDSKSVALWYNKALTLTSLQQFDQALAAFDEALALDPKYAEAWNNKGNILSQLGRHDEALLAYNHAIELGS